MRSRRPRPPGPEVAPEPKDAPRWPPGERRGPSSTNLAELDQNGRGECMTWNVRNRTLFLIRHIRRKVSVAQNAMRRRPLRDSLHYPPGARSTAKPSTRVRSSLHSLARRVRPLPDDFFSSALLPPLAWRLRRAARDGDSLAVGTTPRFAVPHLAVRRRLFR